MPELRHDPVSGRTVVIAEGRAARPHEFTGAAATTGATCAFCPGNESATPPETDRTGTGLPGTPGWRLRAFPNLYPIVGGPDAAPGADGAHEVVALTPDHRRSFADLDDDEAAEALGFIARRVRAHHDAGRAYACAFVNHGRAAGASLAHPHAQVMALDHVPPAVDAELARFVASDPLVDDLGRAAALPTPGPAVAWCPFASISPGLVRVAHPDAGGRFDDAPDAHVGAVAVALRSALAALRTWLADPAYNVVVRSAPPGDWPFHWYVEIVPRVSVLGGFELLTGVLVNSVPPEDADAALRAAMS